MIHHYYAFPCRVGTRIREDTKWRTRLWFCCLRKSTQQSKCWKLQAGMVNKPKLPLQPVKTYMYPPRILHTKHNKNNGKAFLLFIPATSPLLERAQPPVEPPQTPPPRRSRRTPPPRHHSQSVRTPATKALPIQRVPRGVNGRAL